MKGAERKGFFRERLKKIVNIAIFCKKSKILPTRRILSEIPSPLPYPPPFGVFYRLFTKNHKN